MSHDADVAWTCASSSAASIASCGPPFDGVMMWCASDDVPTPTISIPSGRNPLRHQRFGIADDPDARAAGDVRSLEAVIGRETSASAESTFAL